MRWEGVVEPAGSALDSWHCRNNEQNYLQKNDHKKPQQLALHHLHRGYYLYQAEALLPGRLQMNQ